MPDVLQTVETDAKAVLKEPVTLVEDAVAEARKLTVTVKVDASTAIADIEAQIARIKTMMGDGVNVAVEIEQKAQTAIVDVAPAVADAKAIIPAAQSYAKRIETDLKAIEDRFDANVVALEKTLFLSTGPLAKIKGFLGAIWTKIKAVLVWLAPIAGKLGLTIIGSAVKGAASGAFSLAGKIASGVSSVALPALGSIVSAPFKLAGLIPGLGVKAGLWAVLALGVGGVVFAGYLHMEHNTERLIAQAREAAQAEIIGKYRDLSSELIRQEAAERNQAMEDLAAANKTNADEIAKQTAELDQDVPLPPVKSNSASKEKSNAKVDPRMSRLNAADARADRLLERRSHP